MERLKAIKGILAKIFISKFGAGLLIVAVIAGIVAGIFAFVTNIEKTPFDPNSKKEINLAVHVNDVLNKAFGEKGSKKKHDKKKSTKQKESKKQHSDSKKAKKQEKESGSRSDKETPGYEKEIASLAEKNITKTIVLNKNKPYFNLKKYGEFEKYSSLDRLGRCGVAFVNVSKKTIPAEERGSIGMIKPSGWHTVKYPGVVDGNYLYNRCHLVAYCLAGENANEKNLITGTRYLNMEGMLPYELKVAKYMDKHKKNHVLYRVTPVYKNNNLVASGVLMEGYSVEDKGKGVCFCIYTPNIQPGVEINYETGDSKLK